MKQKELTEKRLSHQMMVMFFMCLLSSVGASAQIVLHDATDVTQTKATLSADFPDLSAEHGFQYKYGTLPEIDDFSRLALAELSDPVLLTTTGNPWSARTVKGWVESKSGLSAGQSSVMSATVTFSEQTEISFEWSVDSEDGIGVLSFIVDGSTVESISGEVGFTKVTYTASVGAHTFQWQYKKSAATNVGLDIGMVRNIDFQNTTEGEWITQTAISYELVLSHLYPSQHYIFRGYSENGGQQFYSNIKTFETTDVPNPTFTSANNITQTKAKIEYDFIDLSTDLDTEIIVSTYKDGQTSFSGSIYKYYMQYSETSLLNGSSRGSVNVSNDGYVYTNFPSNITGYLFGYSINVDEPFRIKFEWGVKGKPASIYFLVDGVEMGRLTSSGNSLQLQSFECIIDKGKHALSWNADGVSGSYVQMGKCVLERQSSWEKVFYVNNLSGELTLEGLMPDKMYQVRGHIAPNYQSPLQKTWDGTYSNWTFFETMPVKANILDIDNLKQASVTIRGKIDGGDAIIIATGLQYKDASGTRWVDYSKALSDTLLTQTITRLRPNTSYDYRCYIQAQDCDTVFSDIGTFSTLAVEARKPVLVNRTQHTAELEGKVIFGDASIYQRGMQFRKAGSEEWEEVDDGGNDSIYVLKKTGLEMTTGYQARTYIQPAGSDIIYSEILDFRTKSVEVYIDSITNIYQRNATVHGRIDCTDEPLYGGRISVYRMIGGQISDLVKTVAIPISDSLFVQKVTGLQPNTSYCFIAELDYGDGQKAYSNIHESEVTEIDAYKKALLAPGSSTEIEITYAENWEATDEGLYFGHYAWYDDLTATFTLTKTATISFDWSVVRSYAYSGSTSPDIKLFVDGSNTASKSIAATANNKTFSDRVYLTLNAGTHTLTWRPNYTGRFYVKNLMIPADATKGKSTESATITTRDFFKNSTMIATDITQTKAFLIATLEETDENVEGYEFRYNVTDVLNLTQGENDDSFVTMSVEKGINGNLSKQISGLYPAQNYFCTAVVKLDGMLFASPMTDFETRPVTPHAIFNTVTQTSVWMTDFHMDAGDAEVQDLQYFVPGSDMEGYQDISENEWIRASGLTPDTNYEILLKWTVSGKEYSHSWTFKTKDVRVSCNANPTQTSSAVTVSPNYGTASYVNSGFVFANDSVVNVPLGETVRLTELSPNTSYTIRPFVETVQGGTVYGNNITFRTTAINATTKPVSNISNRSATMNGTIDCDSYSSAEFGFQWKQMEGWNSDPAFTKGVKNEDGSISVALVNGMLEPNTDYQYRTAVRYKGQIYYANSWETFRTESEYVYYPASVYTVFRTDRENNCLILCGYYVAGSETVTAQGYEYWSNQSNARSYSPASTPASNVVTITTDESMQYSLDLKTLADGNYSVRAFVTTSSGTTTYGETLTFGVQNQPDAVEGIESHAVRLSSSGTTLTIHNGMSLVCTIYSLGGTCVAQRKLMSAEEIFDLQHHDIYIIRLSNGKSYKIKL